jgi:superfamily II DNA or RNA helicase
LVIGIHDVPVELLEALAEGIGKPKEIVEEYKEKFLNEVGFLTSEADKNALAVIGWLLKLNLLEIRVAAPKNRRGIYHQKRMIFRDDFGNVICGSGSLNETVGGQFNKEEMLFLFSWLVDSQMMQLPLQSFEDIWENKDDDVEVFELNEVFATQILERIGNPPQPFTTSQKNAQASEILGISKLSSCYAPYNLSLAALYPHQERVFKDALSRWPLRVLLADEVGLGKTLEAGIVIAFMLKFQGLKSATILAPASLVRQWQEEMKNHFDLVFWRWDSGANRYIDAEGTFHKSLGFDSKDRPNLTVVSAHWARMYQKKVISSTGDLVVVDEAHSARVNRDAYGDKKSLMFKLVEGISAKVEHLMLLTATPMQVQPREYHGLLELLGLPSVWAKYPNYELGLEFTANPEFLLTLDSAATIGKMIKASNNMYEWSPDTLVPAEVKLLAEISGAESSPELASLIKKDVEVSRLLLIKQHPANLLTCRNTKSNLEKYDYHFPKRNFLAPEMDFPKELSEFMESLDRYLSNSYGKFETALRPFTPFPLAFARSTYYQRLASSLTAANTSLSRRLQYFRHIDSYLKGDIPEFDNVSGMYYSVDDEIELELDYNFDENLLEELDDAKLNRPIQVLSALQDEILSIEEALGNMKFLGENIPASDPKFKACMKLLTGRLSQGLQTLVFSRYTDTLFSFIEYFKQSEIAPKYGFAAYTGSEVWIQSSSGFRLSSKTDVTRALNSGEIAIVFCSDAASEGLNLQAAQCLVNLDVPWNPARLEQRIGRIARLGQKSGTVDIVNYWYPKSVEADMYARLLARADVYQIAVGEFPDLFSNSIGQQLAIRFNQNLPVVKNAFEELQEAHRDIQRVALNKIWKNNDLSQPFSKVYRTDLVRLMTLLDSDRVFSADPGQENSISILDSELQLRILEKPLGQKVQNLSLFAITGDNHKTIFYVRFDETYSFIHIHSLGSLIASYLGLESLKDENYWGTFTSLEELEDSFDTFVNQESLTPEYDAARTFNPLASKDFEKMTKQLSAKRFSHTLIGKF